MNSEEPAPSKGAENTDKDVINVKSANQETNQDASSKSDMEVQHHPQLDHKPKPWKEYLLEGLMISIAVMLGFIAENIRESITNSKHVSELTAQLVRDLKADTAELNKVYLNELIIKTANDSLVDLLQRPKEKVDIGRLLNLIATSHNLWLFHTSAGAIAAIKNELHLKQFSSSKIIGYISEYEGDIELLHTVQDITLQYQRSFMEPFLFRHVNAGNLDAAFKHLPMVAPEMRNLSQEDLDQLGANMVLIRINTNELLKDNRGTKDDGVKLLQYVKEQFSPKDE